MPLYPPPSDVAITMKGTAGGPNNNNIRIYTTTLVPTVAMGQVIDISSFGFTAITDVQIVAQRATTDPMQVPNVALGAVPTISAITVNITQGNSAVVAILGINVLSGSPVVAATNLSTITLYVRVEGY